MANNLEWVANIVLISNKDDKVYVCIDYEDLNKVSPKENFFYCTLTF